MGVVKTVEVTVKGVKYTLTIDSATGKHKVQATAPAESSYTQPGHFYGAIVKAVDEAGNVTTIDTSSDSSFGDNSRLVVRENTAPVITISAPTAGALLVNNKPQIKFKVTDNDSGVNPDTIKITIDTGAAITSGIAKTEIAGGYECTYTPASALSDGQHTIKVDAKDFDGNAATQKTVTFKVDTVPPVLSVASPVANLITNKAACTVAGTTNDVTSSPCKVTIKLNNGPAEEVAVNADGSFSKALTLANGVNTIVVVSTDSAGKTSTVSRTVTLDTTPPTIKSIVISPNPVDAGKTFTITVEVAD